MPIRGLKDAYDVLGFLGKGTFGEVFKVKSSKGCECALKRGIVQNEIEVLQNVGTHINIIQLLDFDRSRKFIVIEYCNLGDLDCYVRRNPLFVPVEAFMGDMICGLSLLHSWGIAHRDLKPGNILLHKYPAMLRPICKISDFGTSKSVSQSQQQPIINNMIPECYLSTAHGMYYTAPEIRKSYLFTCCGTLFYKAPEVGMGPYNLMCDVFSLGAIFFVLLPKQRQGVESQSFLVPTIAGQMLSFATDQHISSAVMLNNEVHPMLRQMICLMLRKDFKERADISTVAKMYEDYVNHMKSTISSFQAARSGMTQVNIALHQMPQTSPATFVPSTAGLWQHNPFTFTM